jgi:foldase protein PrsA
MATYYRSRFLFDPVVYVQQDQYWQSFSTQGVREGEGAIPARLLPGLEEIGREEAEKLISQTLMGDPREPPRTDAPYSPGTGQVEAPRGAGPEAVRSEAAAGAAPQSAGGAQPAGRGGQPVGGAQPAGAARRQGSRRRPSRAVLIVVAIVVVLAAAVAASEGLWNGGNDSADASQSSGTTAQSDATAGSQEDPTTKEVVAEVGDRSVTRGELERRTAELAAQYGGRVPDKSDPEDYRLFQQCVLEYVIEYELAARQAKELDITVSEGDVQAKIDSLVQASFGGDAARFDEALKRQGMSLDQLERSLAESLLLEKVYLEVTKSITAVPDADVVSYYGAHKDDYSVGETRAVRHILISPGAGGTAAPVSFPSAAPSQAAWEAARETAVKVRGDLAAGADWKTQTAEHSDDQGTKSTGGDLGTIGKGVMAKEFELAAFSLGLNEISQPIKTGIGYHVIQVTGIDPAREYTLNEVRGEIVSTLLTDAKCEAWETWLEQQKAEAGVVYAAGWQPAIAPT